MDILQPCSHNVTPLINFAPPPSAKNVPKYLFRYMPFQAFIPMFYLRQIIFRSAIAYKDQNECTYPYKDILGTIKGKKPCESLYEYYNQITLERARYFISCWFGSDDPYPRETMRNYFSKDGVIVAFNGQKLVDAFHRGIGLSHYGDFGVELYAHGSVEYYTQKDIVKNINKKIHIPHPAFAKTKEFDLENEYRFVVDIGEKLLNFNFSNEIKSKEEPFDGEHQSVFARVTDDKKTLNDIGLIAVVACSTETWGALIPFERLRKAEFMNLKGDNSPTTFRQSVDKKIKIMKWDSAVNNGVEDG